jgi:hypothetical protein
MVVIAIEIFACTKGIPLASAHEPRPNPSIEGTSTSRLRLLADAPHVKR